MPVQLNVLRIYRYMKKTLHFFFLLMGLFFFGQSKAQQDFTLYNMSVIPQRTYLNPAFKPATGKIFIGIPALSSEYLNVSNSGFKYSDVIKHRSDDSLYVDFDNLLSKLATNNYLSVTYQPAIFSFGIIVQKNYISFNVTEKVDVRFRYPKNFMEFVWKGNGALLDKEMNFNFGLNFSHYREYALGAARDINDKLSVGVKLKYLYGMENLYTKKSDITLTTASQDFAITAKANIEINSSGLDKDTTDSGFNFSDYAFKRKNSGAGIDLGAVYKATEKFTLSASILDLGFIKWNNAPTNYVSHDANSNFTFNGFELNQLINSDSSNTKDIGKALGDSLSKIFKIDTLHHGYTTKLSTQVYLGANYNVTEKGTAGVVLYGQVFDQSVHPGIAFSYNHKLFNWLSLSASYSAYNRNFSNIGVGAAFTGGPVQLYIVTDNVLGMIFPQNAKNIHLHFGINILLGRKKDASTEEAAPATTSPAN
jgi:hypothetical protein